MSNSMTEREALRNTLQGAFDFAHSQAQSLLQKYPPDYYPMYTVGGKFGHDRKRWTHWCDGFYPGLMFIFAEATGDGAWLDKAVAYATPLEERQYDRAVHDLGFLFLSTHLRWLGLGGPADRIEPLLIQAGKTMAMRFMERGQYLRSFVEPASLFIDIMMNVGVIFYAGLKTGDERLLDVAHKHCLTTRRTLVRGDGSTSHEAIFDIETGECLRQSTHQGYRGDSCWSRGLAWSLYGFTRSYLQTGRAEYLETAMLNAGYYLENTASNILGGVTPWDYDAPENGPLSRSQVDTSACAIAASGLLDLADAAPDGVRARAYRDFALTSLGTLSEKYLGNLTPGFEGILNGGVYHIHKNLGVHEAVMFGEYFFVEALNKALKTLRRNATPQRVKSYPEDSLPAWARKWHDGPTEEDMLAP
ncbi:MAG TPA: glycoside hydrolase family 88 protein [Blastocatellia bacterium]|jgi:unsaturated chondroitin disaccharide hydrolase|nr:glycoside hydrolase family 88 protein [Blastocatellia bacterium]